MLRTQFPRGCAGAFFRVSLARVAKAETRQAARRANSSTATTAATATPDEPAAIRFHSPTLSQIDEFQRQGFLIVRGVVPHPLVQSVCAALDDCFKGHFDTGAYPDEWYWREELSLPTVTRHGTNFWKSSRRVARMVLDENLARFAAQLMRWEGGSRLGNDSVWLKHSWYVPMPLITAWVTLTDVDEQNGTLEYVPGSHRWPPASAIGRDEFHVVVGQYRETARRLAAQAGVDPAGLTFEKVVAPAGSVVFHHGDLLHGSDKNRRADVWRKSMGVHLISADSTHTTNDGYIYSRYKSIGSRQMSEVPFPILWTPSGYVSPIKQLLLSGSPW